MDLDALFDRWRRAVAAPRLDGLVHPLEAPIRLDEAVQGALVTDGDVHAYLRDGYVMLSARATAAFDVLLTWYEAARRRRRAGASLTLLHLKPGDCYVLHESDHDVSRIIGWTPRPDQAAPALVVDLFATNGLPYGVTLLDDVPEEIVNERPDLVSAEIVQEAVARFSRRDSHGPPRFHYREYRRME